VIVGGRFASLLDEDGETQPEEFYDKFKNIVQTVAEQEIGYKQHKQVSGLSTEVADLCERRRNAKMIMLNNHNNVEYRNNYKELNKNVKRAIKKQKNDNLQSKILEMEENFKKNNTHNLFQQVRQLEGKRYKSVFAMENSQGVLQMKKQDVLDIWKTHFEKHLNTQFLHDEDALLEFEQTADNSNEDFPPITELEVKSAIKQLKNRKSPGIDGITSELIKAGGDMMIKTLTILFNKIIINETPPDDWSKMVVTTIHKKGDTLNPRNYRAIALL